jgi:hypothetical protein
MITRLTRSEFNFILHEATQEQRDAKRAVYREQLRLRKIERIRAKMDAQRASKGLPPRNWVSPE